LPTRSTIDKHPERESICRDLALGVPLTTLSKKYGLSRTPLHNARHRMPDHLRMAVIASALKPSERDLETLKSEEGAGLLHNLKMQRTRLLLVQDSAIASEQYGVVGQISAEIHRNLAIVGQYLGELVHQHHTTLGPDQRARRTVLPHQQGISTGGTAVVGANAVRARIQLRIHR
jgi:hypothetical protein